MAIIDMSLLQVWNTSRRDKSSYVPYSQTTTKYSLHFLDIHNTITSRMQTSFVENSDPLFGLEWRVLYRDRKKPPLTKYLMFYIA